MGLFMEDIQFPTAAPSFDAMYRAICDLEGTDVPATMHRFPSEPRPLSPDASPDAASRRFADDKLTLYGGKKAHLDIHVSEDGQHVFLIGGGNGLVRSSSLALQNLGGTIAKADAPPVRRRREPQEWLEYLVLLPLNLFATLCIGFPLLIFMLFGVVPAGFGHQLRERWREKRLRRRLVSVGRYLSASQLDAKLSSGEGTLIIEHLWSQGFIREWWTDDDLISRSPIPLPASPVLLPEDRQLTFLHAYAASCISKYTDPATGTAQLTDSVPQLAATHRKLSERYPRAKIAVLFYFERDTEDPMIFRSGADTDGSAEPNRDRKNEQNER